MWAKVIEGKIGQIFTKPVPLTIDEIQYPKELFTLWYRDAKLMLDIYEIIEEKGDIPENSQYYNRREELILEKDYIRKIYIYFPHDFDSVLALKLREIKNAYYIKLKEGFIFEDTLFDIDEKAQFNIFNMKETILNWRTYNNDFMHINMYDFANEARCYLTKLNNAKWRQEDEIKKLKVEEIINYNVVF